jgi:hypothetical protein
MPVEKLNDWLGADTDSRQPAESPSKETITGLIDPYLTAQTGPLGNLDGTSPGVQAPAV